MAAAAALLLLLALGGAAAQVFPPWNGTFPGFGPGISGGGTGAAAGATGVPAMFVFGDSLTDNGNNNDLQSLAKANYPPYGIDFAGGPSGRFTNGLTTVDVIGKQPAVPAASRSRTYARDMAGRRGGDVVVRHRSGQ